VPDITKSIEIPGGRSAVIRKLSWKQLKAAGKKQSSESIESIREMGAEIFRAMRETNAPAKDTADRIDEIQKAQARKASQ
jgi:hypothetical protein